MQLGIKDHPLFCLLSDEEDSIDIDADAVVKEPIDDTAETKGDCENERDNIEDDEEQINIEEDVEDEHGGDRSFGEPQQDGNDSVEHESGVSSDESEGTSEGEEKAKEQENKKEDSSETRVKTSADKEDVHSSAPKDRER